MRKWLRTILLLLLLSIAVAPVWALAADESVPVEIPFTVDGLPGTVVIERVTDGAPMPDPASVPNAEAGVFEITFEEPGVFSYKVYQQEGKEGKEYYDRTVYDVDVYVQYDDDGVALTGTVIISVNGKTQKPGKLLFMNPPPTTLEISKTAKRADGQTVTEVFAGDEITYEITVSNTGENSAYDVNVLDRLPVQAPKLTLNENTISHDGQLVLNNTAVQWVFEELPAGEDVTVSFTVTVPPVENSVTWRNTAEVTRYTRPANASMPMPSITCDITEGIPHAVAEKDQAKNGGERTKEILYVVPGDKITYYITLTNAKGSGTALDAVVTDTVPDGLTLVSGSVSNGGTVSGRLITWEVGDIKAGESVTVSFTATVPNVTKRTVWTNQAFGTYINGSQGESGGLRRLLRAGGQEIELDTNKVQAIYDPKDPTHSGDVPKTGDENKIGLWIGLAVVSVVGIGAAVLLPGRGKKNRRQK